MNVKTIVIILIAILCTAGELPAGAEAKAAQSLRKQFNMNPGEMLDIDLKAGGSIKISAWEQNQTLAAVTYNNSNPNDWKITFEKNDIGLSIESRALTSRPDNAVPSFDIKVPQRCNLEIRTVGGDVKIQGISGNISGKTMGGALSFSRLKGRLDFKTMGGDISLTDSSVDGKLKTMAGRVLFENVVGDIKGLSMAGNVIYKNVQSSTGEIGEKSVNISTMGGDINVGEAPNGANVSTMGGDIYIKSASKFIKAKTMGGNITVDSFDGEIKATTMAGDIRVKMAKSNLNAKDKRDVSLSSMSGNIILTVPRGLSLDIDLEIKWTPSGSCKYQITGDFDLKIEKSDRLRAKRKIGSGLYKIKIKTTNGNITLKEMTQ